MKKASNKQIRVLQIGMHDDIGGVETYLMNYYRNIDRTQIQFDFISIFDKLCFEDEILALGGKVYKLPQLKRHPLKYFNTLTKIIKENNYQIVHINMLSAANVLPIIAAKKCNVKNIIVHSHNSNTPSGIVRKIMDKINKPFLNLATHYWACSNKAGKWLFGNKKEIKIIHNAVNCDKFKYNEIDRVEIRKQYNIADKYVIGHVGRFSYQKNHELLIDIFNEYQKIREDAVLMLIGKGELENLIKDKVKNYGIQHKVIFIGNVNDVPRYMSAMDIFVLPSRFEGLPVTGVEAQVNGLTSLFSKNISDEVSISSNTYFIENNVKDWLNILNELDLKESNDRNIDIFEEYNINYAVKKLTKLYKGM